LGPCIEAIERLLRDGQPVTLDQIGSVESLGNVKTGSDPREIPHEVTLHGHLPHQQTLERMAAADVLVVLQAGTSVQIPSKLYEMLLFRKPILALTEPGSTADFIREFELGIVADPSDSEAIADAIRRLARQTADPSNHRHCQTACHRFDGRKLTGHLADLLSQLTKS
jgi:glycosyltransferase involved in cell wall biosynthesis